MGHEIKVVASRGGRPDLAMDVLDRVTAPTLEECLQEFEQIRLIPDRKENLSRQHSGCIRYLQSVLRKRIEITFGLLGGEPYNIAWNSFESSQPNSNRTNTSRTSSVMRPPGNV